MTQNQNTAAVLPLHRRLPSYRIDYASGQFNNTQSGEIEQSLTGVILAYREDRVLWPLPGDPNPIPACVNGSHYGPCYSCGYARFAPNGAPPICSEELTVLLRLSKGSVATLTARRSMIRPIDQYIGMHELLGDGLWSQEVMLILMPGTPRPDSEPALYTLRLVPGKYLESDDLTRMAELAGRVDAQFREGELE